MKLSKFVAGSVPDPPAPAAFLTVAVPVNLKPAIVIFCNSFAILILPVKTASSFLVSFPSTLLFGPNNKISFLLILIFSAYVPLATIILAPALALAIAALIVSNAFSPNVNASVVKELVTLAPFALPARLASTYNVGTTLTAIVTSIVVFPFTDTITLAVPLLTGVIKPVSLTVTASSKHSYDKNSKSPAASLVKSLAFN